MAAKKQAKLKDKVRKLEAKLDASRAEAKRWKRRAKKHEAAAKSAKSAKPTKPTKSVKPAKARVAVPAERSASPDATWTLVQLHAEARARGITGFSRKTKADLIAALR